MVEVVVEVRLARYVSDHCGEGLTTETSDTIEDQPLVWPAMVGKEAKRLQNHNELNHHSST